jgi:two-component system response regulator
VAALEFVRQQGRFADAPRPDLILLDLNLPLKDGREVLADLKCDEELRMIPVVVLTTSTDEQDVIKAYGLHANCYVNKPVSFEQLTQVVRAIEDFWFSVVRLPQAG